MSFSGTAWDASGRSISRSRQCREGPPRFFRNSWISADEGVGVQEQIWNLVAGEKVR